MSAGAQQDARGAWPVEHDSRLLGPVLAAFRRNTPGTVTRWPAGWASPSISLARLHANQRRTCLWSARRAWSSPSVTPPMRAVGRRFRCNDRRRHARSGRSTPRPRHSRRSRCMLPSACPVAGSETVAHSAAMPVGQQSSSCLHRSITPVSFACRLMCRNCRSIAVVRRVGVVLNTNSQGPRSDQEYAPYRRPESVGSWRSVLRTRSAAM